MLVEGDGTVEVELRKRPLVGTTSRRTSVFDGECPPMILLLYMSAHRRRFRCRMGK